MAAPHSVPLCGGVAAMVSIGDLADREPKVLADEEQLHLGEHSVRWFDTLRFNNMSGLGRSGTGTLKVDGQVVDTKKMEKTLPMILQWDEAFDIGSDTLTGVNDADYLPPFTLTAKLNKLTMKVDRPQLSEEDIKRLKTAMRNNKASE